MLAKVRSGATVGLDAVPVEVEVHQTKRGLPSFKIVGLPDKAVSEAKERVRAAIVNSGVDFPGDKITVNLAPADLPKEGPAYDLPLAVGILVSDEQIENTISGALLLGELSLDGSLRHTNGVLPLTLLAREKKYQKIFVPEVNAAEAAIVNKVKVYPVKSLRQLFLHMRGSRKIKPHPQTDLKTFLSNGADQEFDFAEIKGQENAKTALEIAAAGGHNIALTGVPGAGKTMLARAFPSILPRLTEGEILEATKIYSITGNIPAGESIIRSRPFRSPHHTTSRIGLIGGGTHPKPGEISLAHRGVLFLDEFPEFPRSVLESLRQPIEDGIVSISRAAGTVTYPAQFTLIAASNPCPCGYHGYEHGKRRCRCSISQINRYRKKVSGPILDRIDLHVTCPALTPKEIDTLESGEKSDKVRERVQKARDRQEERFLKLGERRRIKTNAEMSTRMVKELVPLKREGRTLLREAVANLGLSARSYYKMIKVARTVADLRAKDQVTGQHIAQALQYRPRNE